MSSAESSRSSSMSSLAPANISGVTSDITRYAACLVALPNFRNDVLRQQHLEPPATTAFTTRGAFSALTSPLSNIHATGVGIRQRQGEYMPDEFVLKVYVFDKVDLEAASQSVPQEYQGLHVDIEQLPIQVIRPARKRAAQTATLQVTPDAAGVETPQRDEHRPIPGGVSISPLGVEYVGTLGCFVRRRRIDTEEIFVLSNNHVLADVDRLERGTPIVQPGPEIPPFVTRAEDTFAILRTTIPIQFPTGTLQAPINRFDAALANITDLRLIQTRAMFGIENYDPSSVVTPIPGMRVVKSGRTTGVTHGIVTATAVDGVEVNYGTTHAPRIAVFDGTIEIVSVNPNQPFSLPGDSGSVILEEATGHPVALLFAGDGIHTTACELGRLCRRLRAWPI